jgi:hypothetical protein
MGAVSFRNNVGSAWAGRKVKEYTKDGKRYAVIENPRWIKFGLTEGSADRIGWKTITVTADMVGRKIAQFLSLEVKTAKGVAREKQVKWHNAVYDAGGLSGFVRCKDDVGRVINGERVDP